MKYILIIGDGMADNPVPSLENKTPLQTANIPVMDTLAAFRVLAGDDDAVADYIERFADRG